MSEFYFSTLYTPVELANKLKKSSAYREASVFRIEEEGEAAAGFAFDLTNNPSKQTERAKIHGFQRSVSVGDIVEVNGVDYLCASAGWIKLG